MQSFELTTRAWISFESMIITIIQMQMVDFNWIHNYGDVCHDLPFESPKCHFHTQTLLALQLSGCVFKRWRWWWHTIWPHIVFLSGTSFCSKQMIRFEIVNIFLFDYWIFSISFALFLWHLSFYAFFVNFQVWELFSNYFTQTKKDKL